MATNTIFPDEWWNLDSEGYEDARLSLRSLAHRELDPSTKDVSTFNCLWTLDLSMELSTPCRCTVLELVFLLQQMQLFDKLLPKIHGPLKGMVGILSDKELKDVMDARKSKKGAAVKASKPVLHTPAKQAKLTPVRSSGKKKDVAK